MAIDIFFDDQTLHERECIMGIGEHAAGALGLDLGGLTAEALANVDAAAYRTAIAGAGALAQRAPFEDDGVDSVF
jgi:malonyl CoA-acyl carrier protein transacylase